MSSLKTFLPMNVVRILALQFSWDGFLCVATSVAVILVIKKAIEKLQHLEDGGLFTGTSHRQVLITNDETQLRNRNVCGIDSPIQPLHLPNRRAQCPERIIAPIAELPDELLEDIVRRLDNRSICQLSLTCRRLHFLALPLFFTMNKMGSVMEGMVFCYKSPPETLHALRISLFLRELSQVSYYFDLNPERLLRDISALRCFIQRFPRISDVELAFEFRTAIQGGTVVGARLISEMKALLEIALERSACLQVGRGVEIGRMCGLFPNTENAICRYEPSDHPVIENQDIRLTGISIHSPILFTPPFFSWILSSLSSSSSLLTTLSLDFKNPFYAGVSQDFLKHVKLPVLERFLIWSMAFPGDGLFLVEFLLHHPSIDHLSLHDIEVDWRNPPAPITSRILPYLGTLCTEAGMAAWLLDRPGLHLRLKHIFLTPYTKSLDCSSDYGLFNRILELLPSRAIATELEIKFIEGSGLQPWLRSQLAETRIVSLDRVRELELSLPYRPVGERLHEIFPHWLSRIFPNLNFVRLLGACRDADAHSAEMEELLRAIMLECPNMRRAEIGWRFIARRAGSSVVISSDFGTQPHGGHISQSTG